MRRSRRHVVLILLAAFTLAVLGCVSSFRRNAPGAGGGATAVRARVEKSSGQQEEKGDDHDGTEQPVSEEKQDVREPTAPPPGGLGPLNLKYVALISERHSGSTWMTRVLSDYFQGKDITVTATLCTWKHWFQDRIRKDIQDGKRPCRQKQQCPACKNVEHTLVIAMWRNPYDWLSGMQKVPWHAQAHKDIDDLTAFITKPWTLEPKAEQLARKDALQKARHEKPCIDNFLPWEVLPCKELEDEAIYELDPAGEAYDNLYELRRAKIRDFNAVKLWAPYYEKVLYEDLLEGNGLRDWLKSLETIYGLSGNYESYPSPQMADMMAAKRKEMYYMNSENCTPHCAVGGVAGRRAMETINQLWDEELEADIGYHRLQQ